MESNHRERLENITEGMDIQIAALTQQVNVLRSMLDSKFVTREEVQSTLLDNLTKQATERFDKMDADGEKRHAEFVKHYEQRLENLATKDEVAGVTATSAENAQRLTVLEATSENTIKSLKERLDKVEDKQLTLDASIKDIRGDTEKIAANTKQTSETVVDFLERDKKRQEKVDQSIRDVESAVRTAVDLAENVDSLAATNYRALNFAIVGNKETKTPGLVDQMAEFISTTRMQVNELRDEQKKVKTHQDKIDADTWWLTSIGRHPYRAASTVATVIVLVLITIAGIFGRPDIVEAIVRGAK